MATSVAVAGPDGHMDVEALVAAVESLNPDIDAMLATWRAAAQRYPQVVSLDDPMFMAAMAPGALGSNDVEGGYMLQASQRIPWFGKRAAAGRTASFEARAAYQDVRDTRVALEEMTRMAFLDYYVVRRLKALNVENLNVVRSFRDTAETKYRTNQVTQQDLLQADVELATLERRSLELARIEQVAVARINTLLLEPPQSSLPPPPAQLVVDVPLENAEVLHAVAVAQRPDLAALAARIRAEQASLTLARKQFYPDVNVVGRYDTFWQEDPLQTFVGAEVNVPICRSRLCAGLREAAERVARLRAEYDSRLLDAQYEVEAGYAEVVESRDTIRLYDQRLVPIAQQNVSTSRANYDVARTSFLDLAVAERQLIELREAREEAVAEYHRRLARLARAVGGTLPSPIVEETSRLRPSSEFHGTAPQ